MRYDGLSRWLTVLFTLMIVGGVAYIFYTSGGSYFPAWLTVLVVSVGLLTMLSVPRYVYVGGFSIEICCLMDVTRLEFKQIRSVSPVDKNVLRCSLPLPGAGVWAVMGYYGYYLDLRRFRLFKLYARSRRNLVRVELKSGSVVIFDVADREAFMLCVGEHLK